MEKLDKLILSSIYSMKNDLEKNLLLLGGAFAAFGVYKLLSQDLPIDEFLEGLVNLKLKKVLALQWGVDNVPNEVIAVFLVIIGVGLSLIRKKR